MKIFILTSILWAAGAHAAELSFSSPAEGSALAKSTVLTGDCKGSNDVRLRGPGIDKNKRISCQKKKSKHFWRYELKNIFKKMPDGEIKIEITQDKKKIARKFIKNLTAPPVPNPANPPNPPPPPPATCKFGSKTLAVGQSIPAYLEDRVAYGQLCSEPKMRTCTASGLGEPANYQYESCTVNTPPVPVGNLDPSKAPATNFDLSLWKITLPLNSSGNLGGLAVEVKPIPGNYEKEPYFYTGSDGAMVFMAPTNGARTGGSKYPRSELREMTESYGNAAWTTAQGGSLKATLAVNEVPVTSSGAKGRVVIGQIHGPDDELCRLYYDNGKLYFYDDKAGSGRTETQFVLKSSSGATTNIPLNSKFDYSIVVKNNQLVVTAVHEGVTYSAIDPISSFWPGKALYFKAGAYVQVSEPGSGAGSVGSGRGQVSFYSLPPPTH